VRLLLALTLALLLAAAAGDVGVIFLITTDDGLAFGELLAGAFVGLADLEITAECGTLGLLFGLPGSIRLGLVLWLGLGSFSISRGVGVSGSFNAFFLLLSLGDGFAGLLVGELLVARLAAPSVRNLFLVVTGMDSVSLVKGRLDR
jgi:hypothetical protein